MRYPQHAYEKGRKAYMAGKPGQANPYTHETSIQSANFRAWADGYRAAIMNDPLLDPDERNELCSRKT